jgi:RND family efflux transporter MFP subunit
MKPTLPAFGLRTAIPGAALLAALGALSACKPAAPPAADAINVPVATVAPASLANDLVLTAEFRPYQDVEVMAKVSGYVKEIRVDIGDHVKTGDVLATLEVPEIQDEVLKAKAGVASEEAEANIAHLSYQRILEVSARDKGLVPRQEVDVAQSRDLRAAALLASAQSALEAAEAMMRYATIRAPFDGVVTKRYADVGSMIQAGTSSSAMPVVRLAQNDLLRLILPVPESAAGSVEAGQSVDIAVSSRDQALSGKITRLAESVQMATRTMDAEVDVPNPNGQLIPGMYAEVHLHLKARPNVLSVPLDAIEGLGTSSEQVYAARGGELHIAKVVTGLQTSAQVEIVSGLAAGDQVVVGRHVGLFDGEKVNARPAGYEPNGAGAAK